MPEVTLRLVGEQLKTTVREVTVFTRTRVSANKKSPAEWELTIKKRTSGRGESEETDCDDLLTDHDNVESEQCLLERKERGNYTSTYMGGQKPQRCHKSTHPRGKKILRNCLAYLAIEL